MTLSRNRPVQYDPTARLFKGAARFAPPPAALLPARSARVPEYKAFAADPPAPVPLSVSAEPAFEPPLGLWTQVPGMPDQRFELPLPTPPMPAAGSAKVLDYSKFRASAPVRLGSRAKLAMLYGGGQPAAPVAHSRLPWLPGRSWIAASALALAALAIGIVMLPTIPPVQTAAAASAMFTTPMLLLRAAGAGLVADVEVNVGQPVDPATVLLTIRPNPVGMGGFAPLDQTIRAGIRGVVWSLSAQPGESLQAGDPLVQLADCGRAFLTVREGVEGLAAGQAVTIHMAGLEPFRGTVRPSAGSTEPADTLVIDPTGFAAPSTGACPTGRMASIQPDAPR